VYKRVVARRRIEVGERRSLLSTLVIGLGILVGFPTATAYQDMVSLVSGAEAREGRWSAFVERSVAGSVHQGELPFVDATATGSISGGGVNREGIGSVALRAKTAKASDIPDEFRVRRDDKRGRIVNIAPVAPPRSFNAGSVFERTSSLLDLNTEPQLRMAFVDPDIKGAEVQIAGTFHLKEDHRQVPGVPAMLASLVTNDKADILATAYAPPAPDYASASPFASLLQEEDEGDGRFIPPIGAGDHAWMSHALPPGVFSAKEQKCLAEGIYFEARSESLKGQAAVAQVILNRVRAPSYPNTICGVVYQNRTWRNRCQFSFACEGKSLRIRSPRHYEVAEEIAMAVTAGKIFLPEVGSSTHYHATYVSPRWARSMKRMNKIGLHIFYRTHGGGWS
jgi:spore germination cell wall hydrolase CwlJ-like protein